MPCSRRLNNYTNLADVLISLLMLEERIRPVTPTLLDGRGISATGRVVY